MQNQKLPIGYWIKKADQALNTGIDSVQSSFGINRTGWQILNSLSEKREVNKTELLSLLSPFSSESMTEQILAEFQVRHLINVDQDKIGLTGVGRELHIACAEKQNGFRQLVMQGITEEDYQTTVQTLQKMVENISGVSP